MITNLLRVFAMRFGMWGLIVACAGCSLLSWKAAHLYYQAQIATMERDQAQAVATARAADVETLKLAKRHGDALTLQLQVTESTLTKKQKELHDAIRTQTTGRACLSGSVVSLLNNSGSTDGSAHLPASTSGDAPADGAAASDTDVADWAANARTQYDICRARLNALIDW